MDKSFYVLNTAKRYIDESFVEKELKLLRNNIDAIVEIAITKCDKKIKDSEFIEIDKDSNYQDYLIEEVYFEYLDLSVWIDVEIRNDSYFINKVDVKDRNDDDYIYITLALIEDLDKYYNKESIKRYHSYKQEVEISFDQKDPYNLRPRISIEDEVNPIFIKNLEAICEEEDNLKIPIFLRHGYSGKKIKLKKDTKVRHLVQTILPIVHTNTFEQVKTYSDKTEIANFIIDNFQTYNNKMLSIGTIKNNISMYF